MTVSGARLGTMGEAEQRTSEDKRPSTAHHGGVIELSQLEGGMAGQ